MEIFFKKKLFIFNKIINLNNLINIIKIHNLNILNNIVNLNNLCYNARYETKRIEMAVEIADSILEQSNIVISMIYA